MGIIQATARDCRTMGGRMNGNPSCHLDWCFDGVYSAAPMGTCWNKVGSVKISMQAQDCRKMGGAMNGNPSGHVWTPCQLDWCRDDVYSAAPAGTCSDKVGYGIIQTQAHFCRRMGGAVNGNPGANTWTACHLDWCYSSESVKTRAISLGMMDREMEGWCGPEAGLLSTSTYPGCIDECAARSNCNAVRYMKESNVCNLMSACTSPNNDSRWRHATKPGNRRLSLSPHGERRLVGGVDIDYTITPQQIANWTAEAEPSSNKLDDGSSLGKHLPVLV